MEKLDQNLERGSQAVYRVLRILLCWKEQDSTLSLTEIAQRTGITLPTAHRMIKALQREGFLVHDKISGNYAARAHDPGPGSRVAAAQRSG